MVYHTVCGKLTCTKCPWWVVTVTATACLSLDHAANTTAWTLVQDLKNITIKKWNEYTNMYFTKASLPFLLYSLQSGTFMCSVTQPFLKKMNQPCFGQYSDEQIPYLLFPLTWFPWSSVSVEHHLRLRSSGSIGHPLYSTPALYYMNGNLHSTPGSLLSDYK